VLAALVADLGAHIVGIEHELVGDYLANARETITLLRAAAESGEAFEVRRLSHSLKSTSNWIGARELARRCLELEKSAVEGMPKNVEEAIAAIEEQFASVRAELESG